MRGGHIHFTLCSMFIYNIYLLYLIYVQGGGNTTMTTSLLCNKAISSMVPTLTTNLSSFAHSPEAQKIPTNYPEITEIVQSILKN